MRCKSENIRCGRTGVGWDVGAGCCSPGIIYIIYSTARHFPPAAATFARFIGGSYLMGTVSVINFQTKGSAVRRKDLFAMRFHFSYFILNDHK